MKDQIQALEALHKKEIEAIKKDHNKFSMTKWNDEVEAIMNEMGPDTLDLEGDTPYRKQLDDVFAHCDEYWTDTVGTLEKSLKDIRTYRDTIEVKLELEKLKEMAKAFEGVEKMALAEQVTPSLYELRDTLVSIGRHHFPDRLGGAVDAGTVKALGDVADKAKAYGILSSDEEVTSYKKKAEAMAKIYDKLTTYRTNSLAPIQMHDYDVLRLQFRKNGVPLNASYYEIHTSGGWKIDFSAGLVFSEVRDEDYFYRSVRSVTSSSADTTISVSGTDTTTTITRVDSTKRYGTIGSGTPDEVDWGLTVMAHFYPRTGTVFNPAIGLGMLVKQDGVSPMLGLSFLFGRKHRLALTGGAIIGNVMRLKEGYEVDGEYEVASDVGINDEVQSTEQVVRVGYFASLTYNFAGTRLSFR
ncbi:MAG: hypothetical protein H6596_02340 [Flavobacteriales bacterium]|nr:hypothetical protein [Flavobacteriales bacterium]